LTGTVAIAVNVAGFNVADLATHHALLAALVAAARDIAVAVALTLDAAGAGAVAVADERGGVGTKIDINQTAVVAGTGDVAVVCAVAAVNVAAGARVVAFAIEVQVALHRVDVELPTAGPLTDAVDVAGIGAGTQDLLCARVVVLALDRAVRAVRALHELRAGVGVDALDSAVNAVGTLDRQLVAEHGVVVAGKDADLTFALAARRLTIRVVAVVAVVVAAATANAAVVIEVGTIRLFRQIAASQASPGGTAAGRSVAGRPATAAGGHGRTALAAPDSTEGGRDIRQAYRVVFAASTITVIGQATAGRDVARA
jgi:hypothetical protein